MDQITTWTSHEMANYTQRKGLRRALVEHIGTCPSEFRTISHNPSAHELNLNVPLREVQLQVGKTAKYRWRYKASMARYFTMKIDALSSEDIQAITNALGNQIWVVLANLGSTRPILPKTPDYEALERVYVDLQCSLFRSQNLCFALLGEKAGSQPDELQDSPTPQQRELSETLGYHQERSAELECEIARLQREKSRLHGRGTQLEGEVVDCQSNVAFLQGENARLGSQVIHIQEDNTRLRREVNAYRLQRNQVQAQSNAVEVEFAKLQGELLVNSAYCGN